VNAPNTSTMTCGLPRVGPPVQCSAAHGCGMSAAPRLCWST
jgi:hypothetical protein